jgi:hypothetical protein
LHLIINAEIYSTHKIKLDHEENICFERGSVCSIGIHVLQIKRKCVQESLRKGKAAGIG